MITPTPTTPKQDPTADVLFTRVVVGIDRSPESLEAARQASILAEPETDFTLFGAWTVPAPTIVPAGPAVSRESEANLYRTASEEAVTAAKDDIARPTAPTTKIVRGLAWRKFLEEASAQRSTLLVVGSHGQGRTRGILVGSTATEVVHKAPCSVLVAREAGPSFPRRIVVGVDGSPESEAAYAVALAIENRFGGNVWPVVAHGGDGVDAGRVDEVVGYHRDDQPGEPVAALVAASADADLLIVGSRGLHGLKALGSVSERVAHRARCSTLIVRPTSLS